MVVGLKKIIQRMINDPSLKDKEKLIKKVIEGVNNNTVSTRSMNIIQPTIVEQPTDDARINLMLGEEIDPDKKIEIEKSLKEREKEIQLLKDQQEIKLKTGFKP